MLKFLMSISPAIAIAALVSCASYVRANTDLDFYTYGFFSGSASQASTSTSEVSPGAPLSPDAIATVTSNVIVTDHAHGDATSELDFTNEPNDNSGYALAGNSYGTVFLGGLKLTSTDPTFVNFAGISFTLDVFQTNPIDPGAPGVLAATLSGSVESGNANNLIITFSPPTVTTGSTPPVKYDIFAQGGAPSDGQVSVAYSSHNAIDQLEGVATTTSVPLPKTLGTGLMLLCCVIGFGAVRRSVLA